MSFNATMKKALVAAAGLLAVLFLAVGPAAADWMACSDEFNDTVIDTTKWIASVEDASQSVNVEEEGYLRMKRTGGTHNNYTGSKAVVLGQVAAPLNGELQVIFDFWQNEGSTYGYSNYGYVQLTPVKHTDPVVWYNANSAVDSVTFMACGYHPTYTDGLYSGLQYVGGTQYDKGNTLSDPRGIHRIRLVENEIDPSGIHVYFEKWEGATFAPKHDFALKTELVSDEYYIILGRNSYPSPCRIEFDYIRAIPEPSTMTLLVMAGLVGLVACVRRRG